MRTHLESFESRMQRQGRLDQPIVPRERWLRGTSGMSPSFGRDAGFPGE
jgi:hypothetical protein